MNGSRRRQGRALVAGLELYERKGNIVSAERARLRIEQVRSARDTTPLEVQDGCWTIRSEIAAARSRRFAIKGPFDPQDHAVDAATVAVPDCAG